MFNHLKKDLNNLKNREKAAILSRFFKTGKGQYGEGDIFLGINVPEQRKIAEKYSYFPLSQIRKLLTSKIHEYRLTSLFILILQYNTSDDSGKRIIFRFYLKNLRHINNWDLVDLSAHKILGDYLLNKDKAVLYKMAESKNLWERRIAIIATYHFIKNNDFKHTLKISEKLLRDEHDLVHKAVPTDLFLQI